MTESVPGWRPDPTGRHELRFWSGVRWSDHVCDGQETSVDPLVEVPPVAVGAATAATTSRPPTYAPAGPAAPRGSWWTKQRWRLPTWAWIGVGSLAVIVVGVSAATGDKPVAAGADTETAGPTTTVLSTTIAWTGPATSPSTTTATSIATTTTTRPATTTTTTRPATTTTTQPPTTTLAGFGNGTRLVNKDIAPGRYIAAPSSNCYWARLSGTGGTLGEILANDNSNGQVIVDIVATDAAFQSSRCSRFVPYVPPPSAVATIGEGAWVVGEQVQPGTYRTTNVADCYWSRDRDATGGLQSIIANDNVDGDAIVTIRAGEVFESVRCKTWYRT